MWSWRRAAKILALMAIAWFIAFGYTWKVLVYPSSQAEPERADAVVLLGGGRGERLEKALELMEDDRADWLIINRGGEQWHPPALKDIVEICENGREDFNVVCLVAEPDSTKGEAMMFSSYAKENGFTSLIYVTTTYHLHRSGVWMSRCFDGELQAVGADADRDFNRHSREAAALWYTWLVDRSC